MGVTDINFEEIKNIVENRDVQLHNVEEYYQDIDEQNIIVCDQDGTVYLSKKGDRSYKLDVDYITIYTFEEDIIDKIESDTLGDRIKNSRKIQELIERITATRHRVNIRPSRNNNKKFAIECILYEEGIENKIEFKVVAN